MIFTIKQIDQRTLTTEGGKYHRTAGSSLDSTQHENMLIFVSSKAIESNQLKLVFTKETSCIVGTSLMYQLGSYTQCHGHYRPNVGFTTKPKGIRGT